tara:strand:- start:24 stop:317 length:294 start_codon:yes stop_codon:yes gene_type:complete
MKELHELIKYLKDNGYEHLKINPDLLIGIIEYFASKQEPKQCTITDVGSSLKVLCKDLNLDPESVLLEYCNTENGFEVFYDEGIEETYLVKKGFIQL